jgi:hypothetical protein
MLEYTTNTYSVAGNIFVTELNKSFSSEVCQRKKVKTVLIINNEVEF